MVERLLVVVMLEEKDMSGLVYGGGIGVEELDGGAPGVVYWPGCEAELELAIDDMLDELPP